MPTKKSVIDAALQELYNRVPTVACKGLCDFACTAIDASGRERQRIRAAGVELPPIAEMKHANATIDDYRCPALTEQGRCSVYELRPMVCRTWGTNTAQPCPHDCEIDGEPLTPVQMVELLTESLVVGGHPQFGPERLAELRAAIADPEEYERLTDGAMAHVRAVGVKPGPWARIVITKR
jgi:Fe-S-cluster containining protein